MSDVADVLRKARELYATNPSHAPVDGLPLDGTHCVLTAIGHAIEPGTGCHAALRMVCTAGGISDRYATSRALLVAEWNAENSTETVLAAFDKAITEATARDPS
jgi:hypothetical protein